MQQNETVSTIDFINKVVEFVNMTPNSKEWDFDFLKKNPPRFIRFQQIISLYNAFINFDDIEKEIVLNDLIQSILNGDFVEKRNLENHTLLLYEFEELVNFHYPNAEKTREWDTYQIQRCFETLLKYKIEFNKLREFNSGILEISYNSLPAYILTNNTNKSIAIKIKPIDEILCKIIGNRTYLISELVDNYSYPTADLDEIDMDWI